MELDYMQRLRWWLKRVDAWPSAALGEKVECRLTHYRLLFLCWAILFMGQLEFLRQNLGRTSFLEVGSCCVITAANVVTLQRVTLVVSKSYQNVTKEFIQEIHLLHHKNASIYGSKIYKIVNKYCRIATTVIQFQIIAATTMYSLPCLIQNISSGMLTINGDRPVNGTFIYSIDYVMPFDLQTKLPIFIILTAVNHMLAFWVGVIFLTYDLYMIIVVFHVLGHLEILDLELRHFIRPSSQHYAWYAPEEIEEVTRKLKMLINYHNKILKFVTRFSNAFSLTLIVYFAFYQCCCCILLLLCSTMETDALVKFGVMTVTCYQQTIQLSAIFEILSSKSKKLTDSVYCLPWECMGARERRLVLSFLHQVQEQPINVKALGILPIGIQTMTAILKSSMSYFIMLRTLDK